MNIARYAIGLTVTATGAMLAIGTGLPASAATSGPLSATANVNVNSTITLSGVTPSFALTGNPSSTATTAGAVAMNVKTNSGTGYTVTVQAGSATMVGAIVGNTDTIPIADLSSKEGAAAYAPLSSTAPLTVHSQTSKSSGTGDALSEDFQVAIPFVSADTYRATLNYTANTQ